MNEINKYEIKTVCFSNENQNQKKQEKKKFFIEDMEKEPEKTMD